jgi:hypothetical protein
MGRVIAFPGAEVAPEEEPRQKCEGSCTITYLFPNCAAICDVCGKFFEPQRIVRLLASDLKKARARVAELERPLWRRFLERLFSIPPPL